ncbi:hypothetical protein CHLRE_01g062902v5 [Chlamydomonas reinhardtii]|uniref:Mediator of RNA polymerase II transcription subunit 7 n=1 Tax=Chlamydomonas reinhardtii TaxID=3055 RepID=A0A2K3E8H1_CHLRE|nr:uncharacterized protein CHLRE_01g062902v5 [Chlamydomonas reinhardtii]PNW89073.1 hypothetical protein CHLRE_01g062902v5 [Chlamydomonas reinhardtii]
MAAAATNGATMREAYPPPPSLFNLYRPDDGVSPLPPGPPPIPTPADVSALRERKVELKVLGNPLKLHEELVPPLTTAALYRPAGPDGHIDFKSELRRLSRELAFMLLELTKAVAEQPGSYASQLTHVNLLFANLVQLTNMLRPYQARATLEATLGLQLSNMRAALGRLRQQVAAADAALGGMARALVEAGEGDSAESAARPAEAGTAEAGAAGAEAGVAAGEGAGTEAAVAAARGADAGRTAAPDAMEEF